jgi:nicotinamidase-related amidase
MAFVDRSAAEPPKADAAALQLTLRRQLETAKGTGRFHTLQSTVEWVPSQTALIVCDMWDNHWCRGAAGRVAEMAPRMNEVIREARRRGVLVVHSPSGTMDFYDRHHPAERKLAQSAPKAANLPTDIGQWCATLPDRDADYPIDQSDGGCDCSPHCKSYNAWKRQIDTLDIRPGDAVSDSGVEIWNLMEQRGIKNVLVMGVHTNMCVLGRPFGIRNLVRHGKNVALVRDMTDTMYNSQARPQVSHFTGTDLIVSHIERHWCPTATSADLAGGRAFRFKQDSRPHLVVVMAEDEYDTNQTLPQFAQAELGRQFRTTLVYGSETDLNSIPGIEALADADVALLSVRRRTLPAAQLRVVRQYLDAGRPLVAIRTSSHAFAPRGDEKPPAGHAAWTDFDPQVLGGNYHGHHGVKDAKGANSYARIIPAAAEHPILAGFGREELASAGTLYKVSPLSATATPLVAGRTAGADPPEPVAWTNTYRGGRVFYTSLGHPEDFKQPAFRRLLSNAIVWAAGQKPPQDK